MIRSFHAKNCRLCGAQLGSVDGLVLDPAPAGAQVFLETATDKSPDRITLAIARCEECGLTQSASAPVSYYRQVITAAGFSASMREHRTHQVKVFSEAYGLTGKAVLEVGCYRGYFLDILNESGLDPHGTEWKTDSDTSRKYPVSELYPGPGVKIPEAPFAAFFCLNFLEHAPEPRSFLKGLRENLSGDGAGLVEVPNYRQQKKLGRVFDYIADHLSYFEKDTLALALMLSGFEVDRLVETRGGENLEAWVRVKESSCLAEEMVAIETTRNNLSNWLSAQKSQKKRLGVWGASHQALTLLAPLREGQIVGIFDSAPFKQGRYAPVTRIPILKPESDRLKALDTILIVASGYEEEIFKSLRETLGFRGEIYLIAGPNVRAMTDGS